MKLPFSHQDKWHHEILVVLRELCLSAALAPEEQNQL